MRYLNKIVFINSAHIPYAEIKLDGNVHFIGTQGVGKSTLLRAILFFYNVDKSRLGILLFPVSQFIYYLRSLQGEWKVLCNELFVQRTSRFPYSRLSL